MTRQYDIFGAPSPDEQPKAGASLPPRKRRNREVKKAPMLVDAYTDPTPVLPEQPPITAYDTPDVIVEPEPESVSAPRIMTISELTGMIKDRLECSFPEVWVSGEVTDFRGRNGKHLYFALKDENAQIRAIIFGRALPFALEDGLKLVCRGKLNVYGKNGSYSLIVDPEHCEPEGIGALKLAFEQLKKRLEAEGLFRRERKRPIPFLPKRIGLVTAPQGAAVRDLVHVLTRRFPNIEILLHPTRVQGEGAALEIAQAIARMNTFPDIDVLIVGRGGGSMEDLWCFNEEVVARAIVASRIPVISAVGHEIDFTIADFVADLRAATPSAAAELAVPVRAELLRKTQDGRSRLASGLTRLLENRELRLRRIEALLSDPRRRLPDLLIRLDHLRERLVNAVQAGFREREQYLARFSSHLDHLSPLAVLSKGYCVAEKGSGQTLVKASDVTVGEEIRLRFSEGTADARVTRIH